MIYFEKYPEPKHYSHNVGGKIHEGVVHGEWKCDNPIVDKVWWTGSTGREKETKIRVHLNLLLKNGIRQEWSTRDDVDCFDQENKLICEAEAYLNSLPK